MLVSLVACALIGSACAPDAPNAATDPVVLVADARTKNASIEGKCADGGLCNIGDTGPGGGIVFYDAGFDAPWGRYLEAMKTNQPDSDMWCKEQTALFGNGGLVMFTAFTTNFRATRAIGRGFTNTQTAAGKCSKGMVRAARNLTLGGKDDWFLPSNDELAQMIKQSSLLGLTSEYPYWSSTEWNANSVAVSSPDGRWGVAPKSGKWGSSRAIRAFSPAAVPPTTAKVVASTTTAKPATSASTTIAPPTTKVAPPTVAPTTSPASAVTGVRCTPTSCRIGDTGPNGGLVFITPSTPGNASGLFFEAEPGRAGYNQAFGCGDTPMPDTGSAIGDGLKNTAQILHLCGASSFIGGLSGTAVNDPKKARFLPSSGELAELVKNLPMLKGSAPATYGEFWSSTATGGVQLVSNRSGSMSPYSRSATYGYALVSAFAADLSPAVIADANRTYKIGDIGPGGGYVGITPSTPGNSTGKYFEVAPSNWSGTELGDQLGTKMVVNNTQVAWSCPDYWSSSLPGTLTGIGTGQSNTALINDKCSSYSGPQKFATREAVSYRGGGRDDWFVPSKDELFTILTASSKTTPKMVVSSPSGSYIIKCIWSSSEVDASVAWGGNEFRAGSDMYASKKQISTNCVLPVRMFAANETRGTKK